MHRKQILIAVFLLIQSATLGSAVFAQGTASAQESKETKSKLAMAIQPREEDQGNYGWSGGSNPYVSGWRFEVQNESLVRGLGFYKFKGNPFSIGLWDSDEKLLASGETKSVKLKTVGRCQFMEIEPVMLEKGKTYVVAALYKKPAICGPQNFYSDGAIRWIETLRCPPGEENKGLKCPDTKVSKNFEFGPNLLLETTESARTYYTYKDMSVKDRNGNPGHRNGKPGHDWKWIIRKEKKDKSHLRDPVVTISFFGTKDGTIRQICLDGKPVGDQKTGAEQLTSLLPAKIESEVKETGVRPIIRVAALSWLDGKQVTKIVNDALDVENDEANIKKLWLSPMMKIIHVQESPDSRFDVQGKLAQDKWTGLFWQLDGASVKKVNFYEAADLAKTVQFGALANWRVPTAEELATIFPAVQEPFKNPRYNPVLSKPGAARLEPAARYWTSHLRGKNYAELYHWAGDGGPNGVNTSNKVRVRFVHD